MQNDCPLAVKWLGLSRLICLSMGLFLAGCASKPTAPSTPANQEAHTRHLQALAAIDQFSLKGRIGVNSQGKGFSGSIAWTHQPTTDTIDIFTPLGSKVANIQTLPDSVVLTTQDGRTIEADNPEALTETAIGLRLPLNGLNDWILGRPSKAAIDAITVDEFGRVSKLTQQGWQISYPTYNTQLNTALPSKITLRNDTLLLRLVVETWQTTAP